MGYKIIYLSAFFTLHVLFFPVFGVANERFEEYEIGESGELIYFKKTPEEIAADTAIKERIEKIPRKTRSEKRWVEKIELAESGITLVFPMSEEQIKVARDKSGSQRLNRTSSAKESISNRCIKSETFEMGDGNTVVFRIEVNKGDHSKASSFADKVSVVC